MERAAEGREKRRMLAVVFGMMQKVIQEVKDVKPFAAGRWFARLTSAISILLDILLNVFC